MSLVNNMQPADVIAITAVLSNIVTVILSQFLPNRIEARRKLREKKEEALCRIFMFLDNYIVTLSSTNLRSGLDCSGENLVSVYDELNSCVNESLIILDNKIAKDLLDVCHECAMGLTLIDCKKDCSIDKIKLISLITVMQNNVRYEYRKVMGDVRLSEKMKRCVKMLSYKMKVKKESRVNGTK